MEDEQPDKENEEQSELTMKYPLKFEITDGAGLIVESGEAKAAMDSENLSIIPDYGTPLFIPYRDILKVYNEDYTIENILTGNERLIISSLGYKYEDFLNNLSRNRNELLIKDLLMEEKLVKPDVEAELRHTSAESEELDEGACFIRLYETAVVITQRIGDPFRIPYCVISGISAEDYIFTISLDSGEKFILTGMGRQFEPLKKAIFDAINKLSIKTQSVLKTFLPEIDQASIRKVLHLMKEGKAAKKSDIDTVSGNLWGKMEERLDGTGLRQEYEFLKSLGQFEKTCIGFKRGLLGDLTGEYIWFLVPIYGADKAAGGNAVAIEASAGDGGGKATYFFRLMGRKEYLSGPGSNIMDRKADEFIRNFNYAMLSINFRREPIYLTEKQLLKPEYAKYRTAVNRLTSLQMLRNLFIGRVIHSSFDQWQGDVLNLLKFNVSTDLDNLRWKK